jgi:hypothetical protein
MLKDYFRFQQFRDLKMKNLPDFLKEGLIFSFTYTKFKSKLEDLLDKYKLYCNINIRNDGIFANITLNNKSKNFYDDFYSLLNLTGYYISGYKKNSDIDYKKSNIDITEYFSSNFYNIDIIFNKKFDFEDRGIKSKLFHVTEEKYRNKIAEEGLKPKSKKAIDNQPERVYFFDDIKNVNSYIEEKESIESTFKPLILEIDVKLCNKLRLHTDPKYPNVDAFYTYDNISPIAISEYGIKKAS